MASSTSRRPQREEEKKSPPIHSFSAGLLEVSIWENQIDTDDGQKTAFAVSFQRSYKDGNNWKKTSALRPTDCLVLAHLLNLAFAWINEKPQEE